MMDRNVIWVELLPVFYYEGQSRPAGTKLGRVLKRAPKSAERRNFVCVSIDNDRAMFTPTASAEVG
jgi:hypothetical protein